MPCQVPEVLSVIMRRDPRVVKAALQRWRRLDSISMEGQIHACGRIDEEQQGLAQRVVRKVLVPTVGAAYELRESIHVRSSRRGQRGDERPIFGQSQGRCGSG